MRGNQSKIVQRPLIFDPLSARSPFYFRIVRHVGRKGPVIEEGIFFRYLDCCPPKVFRRHR